MLDIDAERFIRRLRGTGRAVAARGLVLGAIHPSIGQEAVAAGICCNMARDDLLLSTHRGHGHTLAKGADALAMMRELFGRQGGTCGGKGGSMHIADFGVGMLGANGVVAANIPIAAGAAHALKLRGEAASSCASSATGRSTAAVPRRAELGAGLRSAGAVRLRGQRLSATTRTRAVTAGPGPRRGPKASGSPPRRSTATTSSPSTRRRAPRSRRAPGRGPRLLHCTTYRMTGHTAVDPAAYRAAEEVEDWRKADPRSRGLRNCCALPACRRSPRAAREATPTTRWRRSSPTARDTAWPEAAAAFSDVQDIGDPRDRPF
jgi:acetoin:2,6-dichlorophenolindophenol oxidoreductase subunit alpha